MKPVLETLLSEALGAFAASLQKATPAVAFTVEPPKVEAHGDAATNIALVAAKPLGLPPRKVAEGVVAHLASDPRIARAEIAGPGFINLFLTDAVWQATIAEVLAAGATYGHDTGGGQGPRAGRVRLGQPDRADACRPRARGGVRRCPGAHAGGDGLAGRARVLRQRRRAAGGRAGGQRLAALSGAGPPTPAPHFTFPTRGYPGAYVTVTAKKLYADFGDRFMRAFPADARAIPDEPAAIDLDIDPASDPASASASDGDKASEAAIEARKAAQERRLDALIVAAEASLGADDWRALRDYAVADQMTVIRETLAAFGVSFDTWASERQVVDGGAAGRAPGAPEGRRAGL